MEHIADVWPKTCNIILCDVPEITLQGHSCVLSWRRAFQQVSLMLWQAVLA